MPGKSLRGLQLFKINYKNTPSPPVFLKSEQLFLKAIYVCVMYIFCTFDIYTQLCTICCTMAQQLFDLDIRLHHAQKKGALRFMLTILLTESLLQFRRFNVYLPTYV